MLVQVTAKQRIQSDSISDVTDNGPGTPLTVTVNGTAYTVQQPYADNLRLSLGLMIMPVNRVLPPQDEDISGIPAMPAVPLNAGIKNL